MCWRVHPSDELPSCGGAGAAARRRPGACLPRWLRSAAASAAPLPRWRCSLHVLPGRVPHSWRGSAAQRPSLGDDDGPHLLASNFDGQPGPRGVRRSQQKRDVSRALHLRCESAGSPTVPQTLLQPSPLEICYLTHFNTYRWRHLSLGAQPRVSLEFPPLPGLALALGCTGASGSRVAQACVPPPPSRWDASWCTHCALRVRRRSFGTNTAWPGPRPKGCRLNTGVIA